MVLAALWGCSGSTGDLSGTEDAAGGSNRHPAGGDASITDAASPFDTTSSASANSTVNGGHTDDAAISEWDGSATLSDPCPGSNLPPLWADCSGQCEPLDSSPSDVYCNDQGFYLICSEEPSDRILTVPGTSATIRTPTRASTVCQEQCAPADGGPSPIATALTFWVDNTSNTPLSITVGPPWSISALAGSICNGREGTKQLCATAYPGDRLYGVWTSDPDPPARNIVIQPAPNGCP